MAETDEGGARGGAAPGSAGKRRPRQLIRRGGVLAAWGVDTPEQAEAPLRARRHPPVFNPAAALARSAHRQRRKLAAYRAHRRHRHRRRPPNDRRDSI